MAARPIVVVPGIKGTQLVDTYPIQHDVTWSAFQQKFENVYQLALNAEGTADASEEHVHRPGQVFRLVYKQLYDHLCGKLQRPVYLFSYDWRLSCRDTGESLLNFLHRLRDKFLGESGVDVVCHSMGGLVLRSALAQTDEDPYHELDLNRVVFIATPQKGSLDAIESMTRGDSLLFNSARSIRKVTRTMPSVYELLPQFSNAVVDEDDEQLDVFEATNWQDNLIGDDKTFPVRQGHLDDARVFHQNDLFDLSGFRPERTLQIFGQRTEPTTLETITVCDKDGGPNRWYDFANAERGAGDDVVLVDSAHAEELPAIEIHGGDIQWTEFQDRFLANQASLHAFLPAINAVLTATSRFFEGDPLDELLPLNLSPDRLHRPGGAEPGQAL